MESKQEPIIEPNSKKKAKLSLTITNDVMEKANEKIKQAEIDAKKELENKQKAMLSQMGVTQVRKHGLLRKPPP